MSKKGIVRRMKTHDMILKIDERIGHALSYMDDYVKISLLRHPILWLKQKWRKLNW